LYVRENGHTSTVSGIQRLSKVDEYNLTALRWMNGEYTAEGRQHVLCTAERQVDKTDVVSESLESL